MQLSVKYTNFLQSLATVYSPCLWLIGRISQDTVKNQAIQESRLYLRGREAGTDEEKVEEKALGLESSRILIDSLAAEVFHQWRKYAVI